MTVIIKEKQPQTSQEYELAPRDSHWHEHTGMAQPARQGGRHSRLDPAHVVFTPSWFALGASSAAASLAGVAHFGWPAAAGIGALGVAALAYMKRYEPAHPIFERVELRLPTLPPALEGLRIGQISDTHLGFRFTDDNLAWAVARMRREQPDLIVITGDLVHYAREIPRLPALLHDLHAPLGIYAVPGNHDYWEGLPDIRGALSLLGIPMLLNEHRHLSWNGADFYVAGIDDYWEGSADIDAALRGVPRDAFTVMLSHVPDTADDVAERGVALQFSGHTHGGHLRLPWLGPFSRPRHGVRYVMGEYQVGGMKLYVTRGLGGAPLRLLCRPETTVFTLRRG